MVHGGDGMFLSSLAALSVLMITSHHRAYNSHASLILHHSRPAARLLPSPAHHHLSNREHGTRITVQDLFGNMPVRTKQRAMLSSVREHDRQFEVLSKHVVGYLLAWNMSVMFTLSSPESSRKLCIRRTESSSSDPAEKMKPPNSFNLTLIRSILSRARYIEPSEWSTWIETSARTPSVVVHGAISLQPAPSKNVQFVSLGVEYLSSESENVFYDQINHLFQGSSFGQQENTPNCEEFPDHDETKVRLSKQNRFTKKQLKGGGKGVDRWPMFFIRIDLQSHLKIRCTSDPNKRQMESTLSGISNVLEALIIGFLNDNHFKRRKNSRSFLNSTEPPFLLDQINPQYQPFSNRVSSPGTLPHPLRSEPIAIAGNEAHRNRSLLLPVGGSAQHHEKAKAIVLSDALGGNIKLPSYSRHASHSYEGFGNWSRIKSSRRGKLQETILQSKAEKGILQRFKDLPEKEIYKTLPAKNIERHFGDKSITAIDAGTMMIKSERVALNHAVDSPTSQSKENFLKSGEDFLYQIINGADRTESEGAAKEYITWTNPVSRTTVSLDARTGLVVSQDKLSATASISTNQKRLTRSAFATPKAGSWTSEFLRTWDNPVFSPPEESIPQVSLNGSSIETSCVLQGRNHRCSENDIEKAFTEASSLFSAKLSKRALSGAEVIAQIDKKFILIKTRIDGQSKHIAECSSKQILVLVDQHAADERIRIEGLLSNLCSKPSLGKVDVPTCICTKSSVATTLLAKPVTFYIQISELRLFKRHASHFANWGVLYSLTTPEAEASSSNFKPCRLVIRALPDGIAERCRIDPKVLIEFLRGEVWKREESGIKSIHYSEESVVSTMSDEQRSDDHTAATPEPEHWLRRIGDCPRGILDMLNSRSCRSAIMFNDELTIEECRTLVKRLAKCTFPFQCAHGRPSMIPLVQLDPKLDCFDNVTSAFGTRESLTSYLVEKDFSHAWKTWKNKMRGSNKETESN